MQLRFSDQCDEIYAALYSNGKIYQGHLNDIFKQCDSLKLAFQVERHL